MPETPLFGLVKHESLEWSRKDSVQQSRHRTDFDLLEQIGEGGFGKAYKVKNKVDSRVYALKTVLLSSTPSPQTQPDTSKVSKVLREVQTLSSLSSENIVRYYTAWVEKGEDTLMLSDNGDGIGDSEWTLSSDSESASAKQTPTCHLCQQSYKDWEVSFEQWGLLDAVLQPFDLCVDCYKKSLPDHTDIGGIQIHEKTLLNDYLFILMEYCETNLSSAIQNQIDSDRNGREELIWNYFAQVCQGLSHLHSRGIIHRDVKPNNIFVHKGVVKIGDLGLATTTSKTWHSSSVLTEKSQVCLEEESSSKKSSMVGTYLFTAPEVMSGKYSVSCDIYSLGVLLVDIFSSFETGMERVEVLTSLRGDTNGGTLPQDWVESHPNQAKLALQMVERDPSQRPSCCQILGELIRLGVWKEPTNVPSLVAELTHQITQQQIQLKQQQEEIQRLKNLLLEKSGTEAEA